MANRVSQDAVEVVGQSTTKARVSQDAVEVLGQSNAKVRISQDVLEIAGQPFGKVRVSQDVIEVLYNPIQYLGPSTPQLVLAVPSWSWVPGAAPNLTPAVDQLVINSVTPSVAPSPVFVNPTTGSLTISIPTWDILQTWIPPTLTLTLAPIPPVFVKLNPGLTGNSIFQPDGLPFLRNEYRHCVVDVTNILQSGEAISNVKVSVTNASNGIAEPNAIPAGPTVSGNIISYDLWTRFMNPGQTYQLTLTFTATIGSSPRTVTAINDIPISNT